MTPEYLHVPFDCYTTLVSASLGGDNLMLLEKLGTCKYQNGHMMQVSACTPAASTSAMFNDTGPQLPFRNKKKQVEKL